MTDKEILNALSGMLEPIKKDVSSLKEDMSEVKEHVKRVELRQEKDILPRLKKMELSQENDILPRLQTIESCYTSTYERYKSSVEGYEEMRRDIAVIKQVVTGHSAKLRYVST